MCFCMVPYPLNFILCWPPSHWSCTFQRFRKKANIQQSNTVTSQIWLLNWELYQKPQDNRFDYQTCQSVRVRKRLVKFLSLLNFVYQEPSLVDHSPCTLCHTLISAPGGLSCIEDNRSFHLEPFHLFPSVSLLLANFNLYPFPRRKL